MAEISYTYSRIRKDFGRPPEFQPSQADDIVDIAPNPELREQFVAVDPRDTEIQNVPVLTESQTNTERIHLKHQGQMHNEGGWPTGIDPTEFEEKAKYCKKAERDESYYAACKSLVDKCMDKYLKQNNAIDIYGTYFANSVVETDSNAGPPSAKTVTVFKDPSPVKRTAASLSWLADGKKLAVAYCNLRFQTSTEGMSTASHIWDIQNPNAPLENLVPQSPLCSIEYYGKDPHLIAGGSYNGVVQYWDTRTPSRPAGKSNIEESHKDPVWDIKWLQSKGGELLSVSTDGWAFIWDMRKPEKPTEVAVLKKFEQESLELHPKNNEGGAQGVLGGVCLDYDPQVGGPAKYMIGTEQGTILSCNRKGKTQHEKIGANQYNGHHGPVYSVQRNPHHSKYFLSVGDWTARVWFEDFKNYSMYTTFYHDAHLTSGCWHPQRTGVFFTTRMDGCLDIWDLTYRQSTPVLNVQVSDYALHCIRPTHEGHYVAVGGVDGTTTLIELSPSLYNPGANEKQLIGKMFENESTRDKNLLARAKEKSKQKQSKSRSHASDKDAGAVDDATIQELSEKYLKDVEAEEEAQKKEFEQLEAKRSKLMEDIEEGLEMDE
jgi:dynein intermediate chain 2